MKMTLSVQHFNRRIIWWHLALLLALIAAQPALAQQKDRYPQLLEHDGKQFAAYVNEITDVPYWIIDVDSLDFNLGTPQYLSTEAAVRTAADAFIEAHKDVFGLDQQQLDTPRITDDDEWWFVSYPQLHGSLRILGANFGVTVARNGALITAGSSVYPKVAMNTTPTLSSTQAMQIATGYASIPDPAVSVKDELVILPVEEEEAYAFHLAWEITVSNLNLKPLQSKTFLVDAHTGKILAEYSNIHEHGGPVQISAYHPVTAPSRSGTGGNGELAGNFLRRVSEGPSPLVLALPNAPVEASENARTKPQASLTTCNPATETGHSISGVITLNYYESPEDTKDGLVRHIGQPFKGAKFSVNNSSGNLVCTGHAGEDGTYSASVRTAGSYEVKFEILNDKVTSLWTGGLMETDDMCHLSKSFTVAVDGASRLDYHWGWGDLGDAGETSFALNGVYQIRRMYKYFKDTYSYDGMDQVDLALILYPYGTGSADPSSDKISLGGIYAMSSDIAMHEVSHHVLHRASGLGRPATIYPQAMDEGFASFFAADHTNHYIYAGPSGKEGDENRDPIPWVRVSTAPAQFLINWCTMDLVNERQFRCGLHSDKPDQSPHLIGKILSATMWRIRQDTGGSPGGPASQFLFTALKMPPVITTFEGLRDRYEIAANGAHSATIEARFVERKIGGPRAPGTPGVSVTQPGRNPRITWTDHSSLEDGYIVTSRSETGGWAVIGRLDENVTEYVDESITCRVSDGLTGNHYYRVAAFEAYQLQNEDGGSVIANQLIYLRADTLRSYSAPRALDFKTCKEPPPMKVHADAGDEAVSVQMDSTGVTFDALETYPNPFNPEAVVLYSVREEAHVHIRVFDVLGRQVAVLVDEKRPSGQYEVRLDGSNLPSGVYFIRRNAGSRLRTAQVQLVK